MTQKKSAQTVATVEGAGEGELNVRCPSVAHADEVRAPRIHYTVFPETLKPSRMDQLSCSWDELAGKLTAPQNEHPNKKACPLIKLAKFGFWRNDKDSLRHAENMLELYGIEGDYDAETVTLDQAADRLAAVGIEAVLYTSASNGIETEKSNGGPRWRVMAPLSRPYPKEERERLLAMLDEALGYILASESYRPDLCYYFERVRGVPFEARRVRGSFIDELDFVLSGVPPVKPKAPVEQLDMPEILPEDALPDLAALGLPDGVRESLDNGVGLDATDNRSLTHTQIAAALYEAIARKYQKQDDAMVLSILHHNPHTWQAALDKRSGDADKALAYLWKHHCLKHRNSGVPVIDEFSNVAAQADAENRARIDAARREYQRKQNAEIGDGSSFVPAAEVVTLDDALTRFVFLSDGSRVADILNPHYDLAFPDWAATFAASKVKVEQPEQQLADGSTKRKAPKPVAVSELWRAHPRRKTAICRTFKAGAELIVLDPDGKRAVNMWRPFDRSLVVEDPYAAGVSLFLDHVAYLIPDPEAAGRFLDWLAHIEQCPGVLPHTAWLHIAPRVGMGRNWVASLLTRVWAGSVAANFNLSETLNKGFNGRLSRKVLAIVDEIREGGSDSKWDHSQRMKEMITAEMRLIDPKFGRQSVEFNACRFLLFSNHVSAIPIEKGDRRFEVVINDAAPKDANYYIRLYAAISDPRFIAAVATYLGRRDIRHFNPGARAAVSDAKLEVINSNRTPMAEWADRMVSHWPADVIPSGIARDIVSGDEFARSTSAAVRRALEDAGIAALGKPVKIDGKPVRLSILRNKARWSQASTDELRAELATASGITDPRAELEDIEAESGGERAR